MADTSLANLKVVEIADHISGPYCTKLFADLGAEVIKIEKPGYGDISRRLGPFPGDIPHPEKSGLFIYLNSGKLGVTLKIETATGKRILQELLQDADILIDGKPRKMMEELELDYTSLKQVNPRLVMTSITPWGHTGPYRDYCAYDINITAGGGIMTRLGDPDREPLTMPASQGSYYAAISAAAASMLALYARSSGGPAQHVDVSQVRSWATTYSIFATQFLVNQAVDMRTGRQRPNIFPFTILPVKDGMLYMICLKEDDWQLIMDMMDQPGWADDPKFRTITSRYANRKKLLALMEPWLMTHTRAEIFELAKTNGAVKNCIPLYTIEDMVNSEHLKDRQFFVESDHPYVGNLKYPGRGCRYSEIKSAVGSRAPFLGEHNEEIYVNRLGYSPRKLAKLHAAGII